MRAKRVDASGQVLMRHAPDEPEASVLAKVLDALARVPGVVVWRNASGLARMGKRVIRYGVGGNGAADVLGIVTTDEGLGRFLAIEVKRPNGGRVEPHQTAWLDEINRRGGYAVVVRSIEEALFAAQAAKRGVRLG